MSDNTRPTRQAGVAQSVEQRIRNAWVGGSNPSTGTIKTANLDPNTSDLTDSANPSQTISLYPVCRDE